MGWVRPAAPTGLDSQEVKSLKSDFFFFFFFGKLDTMDS